MPLGQSLEFVNHAKTEHADAQLHLHLCGEAGIDLNVFGDVLVEPRQIECQFVDANRELLEMIRVAKTIILRISTQGLRKCFIHLKAVRWIRLAHWGVPRL